MNLSKNIILISIVSIALIDQLIAQPTTLMFDKIGLDQGLSQSTVYAIVQDKLGFMWFGTQDGLNLYDGYEIKVFKHKQNEHNSIADDRINCLLVDSRGDLWIGTSSGGLDRYVIAEDRFYHYYHIRQDPLSISNNTINAIFEDSQKNIWVGTNQGLNLYNPITQSFTRFYFGEKEFFNLNENAIKRICESPREILWLGTFNGLFKIKLNEKSNFERVSKLNTDPRTKYGDNVTALFVDHSGVLWIGTFDASLKFYNRITESFTAIMNTPKAVNSIYEDSVGNLWIASAYSNLIKINLKTKKIVSFQSTEHNPVNILYKSKDGILWIGTVFGGVYIYNPTKNQFKRYLDDDQNRNVVMAILEDKNKHIWVGTFGSGLKHFDENRVIIESFQHDSEISNTISSDKILTLCEASDGNIWIGTLEGGLDCYNYVTRTFKHYKQSLTNDKNGLSNNDITTLYEDHNGNLWIGYVTGAIDVLEVRTKKIKHFDSNIKNPNTLGGGMSVTSIREDQKGTIWAGTLIGLKQFNHKLKSFETYQLNLDERIGYNSLINIQYIRFEGDTLWIGTGKNGLLVLELTTGSYQTYTTADGLSSNFVYSALKDNSGNVWMSTNNGISKFNPLTKKFKNYDISVGLQSIEFNQGAYFKARNGEIFFGGVNGLNSFYPDDISENKIIPSIYITSFKIFDKTLPINTLTQSRSKITLSYFENFFSFQFVALNYTSPEKNRYAYMLEGFDKDWHYTSSFQRYASYTNIDPGEYLIRVKGSNNDDIWNDEGVSVTLVIEPAFWMTWWFKVLAIMIILSIIVFIYNYRVTQIFKIERMRVQIAADLHDEIGSSVGSIVLRSRMLQKEFLRTSKSREEIVGINRTAMQITEVMRDIVWFVNPEFDKLDDMILRMKDTAQSLLTGIPYEIIAPAEILSVKLSLEFRRNIFLSYKEILHNIIKHSKATKVKIEVGLVNRMMLLAITDDGIGFETGERLQAKTHDGNGLNNLKKRVNSLNGILNIQSAIGQGTKVMIKVKTT